MHIEQPGSRHSAPACLKIRSRPSASACCFTCWEPGTTSALQIEETLRPFNSLAACRKSDKTAVGAGTDKNHVHGVPQQALTWLELHVTRALFPEPGAGPGAPSRQGWGSAG